MGERTDTEIAVIRSSLSVFTNHEIFKDSTYKRLMREIDRMRYGGKNETEIADESKDTFLTDFGNFYTVKDVYKTKMFDYVYFRISIHYPFNEDDASKLTEALAQKIERFNVYPEIRFVPYYLTKISLNEDKLRRYTYINLYIPSFNMYTKKKFDITADRCRALDNFIYKSVYSIIYKGIVDVDIDMLNKIKVDVDNRKKDKLNNGGKYTLQGIKEANNIILNEDGLIMDNDIPF